MEKLFAYGTLKDIDIQQNIFGRILRGTADTLIGYTINEIRIEEEFGIVTYPIITATDNQNDIITGILYEISELDLEQADIYEGMHYKRIQVKLESNEVAWTFTAIQ